MTRRQIHKYLMITLAVIYTGFHIHSGIRSYRSNQMGFTGKIISKSTEQTRNGNHNQFNFNVDKEYLYSTSVGNVTYQKYNVGDIYQCKRQYNVVLGEVGNAYCPSNKYSVGMFRSLLYMITNVGIMLISIVGAIWIYIIWIRNDDQNQQDKD